MSSRLRDSLLVPVYTPGGGGVQRDTEWDVSCPRIQYNGQEATASLVRSKQYTI